MIIFGTIFCFSSTIIGGIGYVVNSFYHSNAILWTTYSVAYILEVVGLCSFKANVIQYTIDQLVGASAELLNTFIYWNSAAVPIVATFFEMCRCLIDIQYYVPISSFIAIIAVSTVLVSYSCFKHKLENISLLKNPIKLIVRVLCYAWKHKYPENRSALTYWEEEAPSRLDLGKDKYGGPFTEEEVEDVKTFFRMLPLLIATVSYAVSDEVYHWIMLGWFGAVKLSFLDCAIASDFFNFATSTVSFIFWLLIIKYCFQNCIPSILKRLSAGQVVNFIALLSKLILLTINPLDSTNTNNAPYTNNFLILSQFLDGLKFILIIPASLEFTVAQSPVHMRGVMVGLWLASMGCGYLFNINLKYPFGCDNEYMCTSYQYYLIKCILVLIFLIVFLVLAKFYKYRVRENEVNVHLIVDDHYQRYMEQEEEYSKRERNSYEDN
uniref:Uncharacterized protein n=1 Tax=Amphimedon queenslandica TaxID=400682 RepID=A0A1X7VPM9_AMPQE